MTISRPIQIFALVGLLAVLGLGGTLALQGSRTSSPPATPTHAAATHAASTTASHAAPTTPTLTVSAAPAKPRVQILPGVPAEIARALQAHKTVVVTLYEGGDTDRLALTEARAGAAAARVGFVGVNVLKAHDTAALASFANTVAEPTTLVVSRPGRVVRSFTGVQDRLVVAQAAHDAR